MPTPEQIEQRLLSRLKRLSREWPEGYWIFVAGGVHLMRYNDEGQRAYKGGGVDQDYVVGSVNIPSDGGDW